MTCRDIHKRDAIHVHDMHGLWMYVRYAVSCMLRRVEDQSRLGYACKLHTVKRRAHKKYGVLVDSRRST